jgi:SAM-dependent methyltransferase
MKAAATLAPATRDAVGRLLRHRAQGAALLAGRGLEIGALHYPLALPRGCAVDHLDVEDTDTLRARFPELADEQLVVPRYQGDVVRDSLPALTGRRFDFVVANHVLEHVANPIQALANLWAGLVEGGHLVVSVPDKAFTYDRPRPVTSFEHLLAEYFRGVTEVDADHYVEFLAATSPEVWSDRAAFLAALARAAERREHAHVWDSASFRAFWDRTATLLGFDARLVFESTATTNGFEYFAVLRRGRPDGAADDEALAALAAVYGGRPDLRHAMPSVGPRFAERLLDWALGPGTTVDSAVETLRPFQAAYRRWRGGAGSSVADLDDRLRRAVGDERGRR